MILRSRKISGPEALRIGPVHEVWPLSELKAQAIKLAHELAAQPAQAMQGMLKTIIGCEDKTLNQLSQDERSAVLGSSNSADSKEGMAAFLGPRKP